MSSKTFSSRKCTGPIFKMMPRNSSVPKSRLLKLAELVLCNDADAIAEATGVHIDWATQICEKLRY